MNHDIILKLAEAISTLNKRLDAVEALVVLSVGAQLVDRGTITEQELREVMTAQ